MSVAGSLGYEASYRQARRMGACQRLLSWLLIVGVHVVGLAGFVEYRAERPETPAPRPLRVSLISAPPAPEPPPPAQPPPPLRPQPQRLAATRPTPAAIEAPPVEELPPVEARPEAPPPPAPAAPSPPAEPAVIPPDFVAAHLDNPGPKYPYVSRQRREEGTVLLRVLVGTDGRPEQVLLEHGSGSPRLDEAAIEVVRERWRFVPARRGDQALAAWVRVPIIFELRK